MGRLLNILVLSSVPGLVACGADADRAAESEEPAATRYDPIVGGTEDTGDTNNNVVLVDNAAEGICTGALIAPNMVLTSHGCVAQMAHEWVDCQNDFVQDYPADSITISVGATPGQVVATGVKLYNDHNKSACGHDIALIQIAPPILNVTPIQVRVAEVTALGELFTAVGYGLTDPTDHESAGTRHARAGVEILEFTSAGEADFVGTQSQCAGDGGGPAISQQGAVIGVASRGADCLGDENIWTRTDKFKWLIDKAVADVGGSYTDEDGAVHTPTGTGGAGGSSGAAGAAGASGGGGTAGAGGTSGAGGSAGTAGMAGDAGKPSAPADDASDADGGCTISAGKASSKLSLLAILVVGLGLVRRRI